MQRKAAAMALLALVALPAAAGADGTARDRTGDVRAPGLSSKERAALDIVRTDARAKSPDGLRVSVRLRGDYERAAGRAELRDSYVAIVLRPRAGDATVVATDGTETLGGAGPGARFASVTKGRKVAFSVGDYPHETLGLSRIEVVTDSSVPTPPAASKLSEDSLPLIAAARDGEEPPADDEDMDWKPCRAMKRNLRNNERAEARLEERRDRARGEGRRLAARRLQRALDELQEETDELRRVVELQCGDPRTTPDPELIVEALTEWVFFGTAPELKVTVKVRRPAPAAAGSDTIDAVRLAVPGGRQITESLCSDPLPTRDVAGGLLTCSGGTLPLEQSYEAFLRTDPTPEHGMGIDVAVRQDGQFTESVRAVGPARSCGFIFNPSIVLWQCSLAHGEVRFDFSRTVAKTSQNDTCQLDAIDPSVIVCPGSHGAFTSDAFTIDDPCAGTTLRARVAFAPGDVQEFPEKACS
jgi:hypothetical protein